MEGKFIGTENMLIGFAVAAVILFNGKYKRFFFFLIFSEIVLLLYLRYSLSGDIKSEELALSAVYYTVALILIFQFVDFFLKEFYAYYQKIEVLNKKTSESG